MDALARLGIDGWSVVLYLVNFGLLAAVLTKLLYKPALKFMDERRETIRRSIEEAEELKRRFEEETKRREEEARLMSLEMQRELKSAREHSEADARKRMADAEAARERMMVEAEAQIASAKSKLKGQVEHELLRRVEAVTMRVLSEKIPAETVKESVGQAWKELNV